MTTFRRFDDFGVAEVAANDVPVDTHEIPLLWGFVLVVNLQSKSKVHTETKKLARWPVVF